MLSLSLILLTTGIVVTFSRAVWGISFFAIVVWFGLIFWKLRHPERLAMRTGDLIVDEAPGSRASTQPGKQKYFPGKLLVICFMLLVSLGLNWFFFGQQIKDRASTSPGLSTTLSRPGEGLGERSNESFAQRQQFNNLAIEMIKQNPLLGVGLGDSVIALDEIANETLAPHLHQPVHNIYLLIAAESGLGALIALVIFLFYVVKQGIQSRGDPVLRYSLLIICSGFLLLGFIDHYLWTIQQTSLAFWIAFGLLAGKVNS